MEAFVIFKALLKNLVMPVPMSLVLVYIGLYLFVKQRQKLALRFVLGGIATLLFFSLPITSQLLIKPLESAYPKFAMNSSNLEGIRYIWVFGCHHSDDPDLPLVAQLDTCSLPRVVQAVQIHQQIPESKIIFSGYGAKSESGKSDPRVNAELAMSLGVNEHAIILIEGTTNSEMEVSKGKVIVKGEHFVVVSSASHLTRLNQLFAAYGLSPKFSPAEYLHSDDGFTWRMLVPDANSLYRSERAIYEILGNLWFWVKL